MDISRRGAFGVALAGGAAALLRPGEARAAPAHPDATLPDASIPDWKPGFDNQRICDLGDGRFLNPLLAGDHPDPAILKDGADFFLFLAKTFY